MEGVGAAQGGQAAVPLLPVTAPCWPQCVFTSGKSPSLPNQVFYRLLRLSAKLCETRVGLESWGCSPEGRKWSCLEPKDHRGGSSWCSPWARKWAVGGKFTLSGGTSRAIVPFYLAVSRTPLNSVIFMPGQIFKKKGGWREGDLVASLWLQIWNLPFMPFPLPAWLAAAGMARKDLFMVTVLLSFPQIQVTTEHPTGALKDAGTLCRVEPAGDALIQW